MNTSAEAATWHKSSYSGNQGTCVETAPLLSGAVVGVRDSKDVKRGHLSIPLSSWSLLTAAIKD